MSKMKSIRSMPSLASQASDEAKAAAVAKTRGMKRSQSMATNPEQTVKHLIRSVPFMAIPGVGQHLLGFTRSVSRAANLARLSAFGSFGSIHDEEFKAQRRQSGASDSGQSSPGGLDSSSSLLPRFFDEPSYTWSLAVAVTVAVLTSFQVGYNSGVINVPEQTIRGDLLIDDLQWSIAVSIFCIGGLVGSMGGGRIADKIGRKNFLVANNVMFIAGALFEALAYEFILFSLGRFIIGIGCGGATVVVPLYLGEISPAHLRGSIGSMNQFAMVIGILIANLLGNPLGGTVVWRYLLGLVLIPALFQIILSSFLLESPLWLVGQRTTKSMVAAEEALAKLRGSDDVEFEIECMVASKDEDDRTSKESALSALMNPSYRLPLTIGLTLQLAQQFSGINVVFYYSTGFFASAHVSDPWLGSVLAASVNMLATALAIPLMDRVGRRVLIVTSAAGMAISCLGLTAALYYMENGMQDSVLLSTASVFGVLLYVTFFEIGLGPIPWLIGAEIYPSRIRSSGMSMASIVNWSANFLVGLSFPHINNLLQSYTFLPFATILIFVIIFVIVSVPETRGKSLEEIQEELERIASGEPTLTLDRSHFGSYDSLSQSQSDEEQNEQFTKNMKKFNDSMRKPGFGGSAAVSGSKGQRGTAKGKFLRKTSGKSKDTEDIDTAGFKIQVDRASGNQLTMGKGGLVKSKPSIESGKFHNNNNNRSPSNSSNNNYYQSGDNSSGPVTPHSNNSDYHDGYEQELDEEEDEEQNREEHSTVDNDNGDDSPSRQRSYLDVHYDAVMQ